MNLDKRIICVGIVALFVLVSITGCVEQPGPSGLIVIPLSSATENPKDTMASYYSSEDVSLEPDVPQYDLPLNITSIINFNKIDSTFGLNDEQEGLLSKNGFVVWKYWQDESDIIEPYNYLKDNDIPIFVTSDTLLHLYHIQFDEILKGIEQREFFDIILDMSKSLFEQSKNEYNTFVDEELKEAARRNVAFFGVVLSLLQMPSEDYDDSEDIKVVSFSVPNYVEDEVNEELSYIALHDTFHESPVFHYQEDYSQYKPRGHYTQTEKLTRYFKAMMWYGRMAFLMKGGDPHCQACEFLISEEDAKIATIQASLISTSLPNLKVNEVTLEELWNRIYTVTSFFVGTADDLTPYEYLSSIKNVFGLSFNATELANDTKLLDLKVELFQLRSPEIYGGTGNVIVLPPVTEETLMEVLEKTKGLRFMSQRFIPDSYMFQHLVTTTGDYIGDGEPFTMCVTGAGRKARCFPRGLDVMAVLGSDRAYEILVQEGDTEYEGTYEGVNTSYDIQLAFLKEQFSDNNISIAEWNRNLYWSWLYTLKSLLEMPNNGYPIFMQSSAWIDKQLQTALASWAELRHDTILYAKQSYGMFETGIPEEPEETIGYVEPVPTFYSRLLALTQMTYDGLTDMDVLNETESIRLQNLATILNRLLNISLDELENKTLSDDDYDFIRDFGLQLESLILGVTEKAQNTTLIADVHTDTNTEQVLEEGVGYVDLMIVAYKVPDGRIIAGAGPVLSYYEFKHPMDDRLTDEQWREMLKNGEGPDRPVWISTFVAD